MICGGGEMVLALSEDRHQMLGKNAATGVEGVSSLRKDLHAPNTLEQGGCSLQNG